MLNNSFNLNNSTAGARPEVAPTRAASSENKDMFTKLLVAQIRNQDPLAPSDPSEFVNQLSQLSQTEALQNLAQMNSASASMLQSLQVLAMGAQVGAEVSVATDRVRLDGKPVKGSIMLDGASAATTLVLTGADQQKHSITLPAHGAGALPFTLDPAALGLPDGSYTLTATSADGRALPVEINSRLDSVRMAANGGVLLQVANIGEVDPSAITGFNGKAGLQAAALPPTAY
ncbi:MAG TPA: flagellar hook capping FlgD N-terminal domain-containing protein [Telluria sp.]